MAPKRSRGSVSRTPPPPRGAGGADTGGGADGRRLDTLSSSEENSLLRGSDEESTVPPGTGPRCGPPPPAPVNGPRASTRTTPVGPKAAAHGPPVPTPAPEPTTTTGTALPYATPVQALLAHAGTARLLPPQLRCRSRCLQVMVPEALWWLPYLTTWPSRLRSRCGLTLGSDADHVTRCAGTSEENPSCIRIACYVPSSLLPAVHLQSLIALGSGLMSAMQPDSDYESLCVQASCNLVVNRAYSWSPTILLHSGGGPARGRLSCPACCPCWLSEDCASYRRPLPSWWCLLLTGRSASGPSPVLQTRSCHGRCAAPSLTVWRTAVLFGLFPGTPAVAEDNPWSDSWAIASQHSRVLLCYPSRWTSCVQEGWAYSGTYVTNHACRYLSTNQSGFALDLHTLPAPSPISPPAWPVLMAPKLRRWRYKPGQRERRERREARARATEAGSYRSGPGEPPLTLYHPRLSSSSGFEEEEYVEVLVEDDLGGLDRQEETQPASHPPEPKLLPKPKKRPVHGRPEEAAPIPPLTPEVTDTARGHVWQDGAVCPLPASGLKISPLGSLSCPDRLLLPAPIRCSRGAWRGGRHANLLGPAPARLGGRPRTWRIGAMARLLKRPWNKHWKLIFQSCHAVWQRWQGGEPQTADTYFWLANACRLVYPRSLWPRIQNHLLSLHRFASCKRTCELIRSHRRADRRLHSSAQVTKYMLCCPSRAFSSVCHRMSLPLIFAAKPAGPLASRFSGTPHDHHVLSDSGCRSQTGVAALVVFRDLSMFHFGRPAFHTHVIHVVSSARRDRCTGLYATLAGGRAPQYWRRRDAHVPLTRARAEGWPHVLLCPDETRANVRSFREPGVSASLKCFVCRYDVPASLHRRRPGKNFVTVGTSHCVGASVPLPLVSGLCQASGQARWRCSSATVLSFPPRTRDRLAASCLALTVMFVFGRDPIDGIYRAIACQS